MVGEDDGGSESNQERQYLSNTYYMPIILNAKHWGITSEQSQTVLGIRHMSITQSHFLWIHHIFQVF